MTEKGSTTASISIHALTRSATLDTGILLLLYRYFNPRTHEECDVFFDNQTTYNKIFQSTHSRGVRPSESPYLYGSSQFQSTHSRGVRLPPGIITSALSGFQSTHSRGVRRYVPDNDSAISHFNPRTHEECDSLSLHKMT